MYSECSNCNSKVMVNSFSKLFYKHFLSFFFKILSVMFGIVEISSPWLPWLSSFLLTVFFLFFFFFFFLNGDKFCSFLEIILVVSENVTNFTVNISKDDFFSFVFKFKKESISFIDHFIHNGWGLDGN